MGPGRRPSERRRRPPTRRPRRDHHPLAEAGKDTTFAVEATTPDVPLSRTGLRDLIAAIVDASQVEDPEWGEAKCA